MDDGAEKPQPSQELKQSKNLEPIGARILGDVNPTTLTQEQFNRNPNLLYHGAASHFDFQPAFDYRFAEYCTNSDGSQTLGEGFYTTDSISSAKNYSLVRQPRGASQSIVIKVLPYQARVLDLRSKQDQWMNAPIPKELFSKWFDHFKTYFMHAEIRKNLPYYTITNEQEYLQYLIRAKNMPAVDLRVMLETAPDPNLRSRYLPSPPWMKMFSNFMKLDGYDGIVYIEGGEGAKRHNSHS